MMVRPFRLPLSFNLLLKSYNGGSARLSFKMAVPENESA